MTTNDRSRQQSGEAPQRGTASQQGGRQDAGQYGAGRPRGEMAARGGEWQQGGRSMPAQRGAFDPALYGGFGGGPFALMRRISEEMDRMFESFGMGGSFGRSGFAGLPGGAERGAGMGSPWSPHLEVFERQGRLVIQADLPGVRKEDVSVQIEDDRVILQGERRHEQQREENGYFHTERSYGSFHRVIPLPEGVDADQAKASFRDGVLEIELPAPQPQRRGRALTIEDRSTAGGSPGGGQAGRGTSGGSGTAGGGSMSGEAPTG